MRAKGDLAFHISVTKTGRILYDQFPANLFTFQGCRYLVLEFMLAGDLQKVFNFHKKLFCEMQAR